MYQFKKSSLSVYFQELKRGCNWDFTPFNPWFQGVICQENELIFLSRDFVLSSPVLWEHFNSGNHFLLIRIFGAYFACAHEAKVKGANFEPSSNRKWFLKISRGYIWTSGKSFLVGSMTVYIGQHVFFYSYDMKSLPCTIIVAKQNRNHSSEHSYKTGTMNKNDLEDFTVSYENSIHYTKLIEIKFYMNSGKVLGLRLERKLCAQDLDLYNLRLQNTYILYITYILYSIWTYSLNLCIININIFVNIFIYSIYTIYIIYKI